jgi:hypothetical protein
MGMRAFFFFFLLLIPGFLLQAQDIIYRNTGETIEATIVDISPGVIKYKKYGDQQGPVYSIAREQVEMIIYADGKITRFEKEEEQEELPEAGSQKPIIRPSPTFGWHLGFGPSSIYGDIENAKARLASTIGASFVLPTGQNNTVMFGVDILSVGCGLRDFRLFDDDDNRWEFSEASEDMGYISLLVMDRIYLNVKRNYFLEGGGYGSFLLNASFNAQAEVYNVQGTLIDEGPYSEDWTTFYKMFDLGLAAGLGGRIPLGKNGKWHITAEARIYYGLTNIFDLDNISMSGIIDYRESNIFGLLLIGVDIATRSKD